MRSAHVLLEFDKLEEVCAELRARNHRMEMVSYSVGWLRPNSDE
jgi:hypothetical protein